MIRSRMNVQFLGEDPIEGNGVLTLSLDDARPKACELSFRYQAYPFSVRETHSDVKVNERIPPETFAFVPTPGAIQVDDLGERDEEVRFSAPARR